MQVGYHVRLEDGVGLGVADYTTGLAREVSSHDVPLPAGTRRRLAQQRRGERIPSDQLPRCVEDHHRHVGQAVEHVLDAGR
jgi:hypothetical protein